MYPPHPFTPQISNSPPRPQFLTLLHPAQAQHPNTHRLQTAAIRPTTKKGSRAQSSYVRIQLSGTRRQSDSENHSARMSVDSGDYGVGVLVQGAVGDVLCGSAGRGS